MLKKLNIYRGLPKNMYILFWVQVINRFGDFVAPFLTLYLTEKLGMSLAAVGIIVTASSLLGLFGSMLGGKLGDEMSRKKTYLVFQAAAAILLIPCAFINNVYVIVAFILMSTLFNGAVRPPLNAIITDILPPDKRKLGFSLQYLGINIGVAIGPIIAGFLFNNYLPMLFLGDAATSLIAVVFVAVNIKESTNKTLEKASSVKENEKCENVFEGLIKKPEVMLFLLIYMIYSFVYTQHRFSLPIMMDKVFLSAGSEKFGMLMSINAVTVIGLTIIVTKTTKGLSTLSNIIIAGIFYAVGFGMIGVINSFPLFIVSTVIWTIGEILVVTNFGVYLANNSPNNFIARFNAIGSLSWAIGSAAGTSVMGKYIDSVGIYAVWPLTFLLAIIGTVLMLFLKLFFRKRRTADSEIRCES